MASAAPVIDQSDLDIAGLVRYVRVELQLTQREFGRLLGVRQDSISLWEHGHKRPALFKEHLIQAFADAVDQGGVPNLQNSLEQCGPAFALWRVLDKAYNVDL